MRSSAIFLILLAFVVSSAAKVDAHSADLNYKKYMSDKYTLGQDKSGRTELTGPDDTFRLHPQIDRERSEDASRPEGDAESHPTYTSSDMPNLQIRVHKVGNIHMTVTNYGMFGDRISDSFIDPETGLPAPSCEYPAGSGNEYIFHGGLWIGAIVGDDTLVTVGVDGWQNVNEMFPEGPPEGDIEKRSTIPSSPYYSPDAISEADYIAIYYDTLTDPTYVISDPFDARPHLPLGLKIRQESYSWSDPEYDDFIIFRFIISNIAQNQLDEIYFGFYCDADILNPEINPGGFSDDISGSIQYTDPLSWENVLIGWSSDNDGDPDGGYWYYSSPRGAIGVSLLDFPAPPYSSFNWWVPALYNPATYDWGPMLDSNYRDFGTGGKGTPSGDRNKYYIMANAELDYDQMFAAIDHTGGGWLPPPVSTFAVDLANGYDARFLFSFGETDLSPGDSMDFAFVLTVGDEFHKNPDDFSNLFDPQNPQLFYDSLDFSNLIENVQAARQLYRSHFPAEYSCGDANNDGLVTLVDAVWIIDYVFINGLEPYQFMSGEVNCDGSVNISDAVWIVNYLYIDGKNPCDFDGDGIPDC
ncbi:MAG: hypothetical protein GWO41_06875 [candidate division Zixibacteria bacterium]|nr:hypothetical protein [candidate division Zixibacteria bacterium]NIR63113.1 hypothetical protein [candidate division Zixibacteria bacterium]NIS16048.1 hypothetical protein [candidate division Zixibacteria bacterium]NIS46224.1 hypothetical protein [candidate division Zixibacteria bacterium]NIT52455.1 hypothetical protein [candidate division Zixibacteria bacterium]